MNILFIIDPIETLQLASDTSFAIMAEAHRRGYKVFTAALGDLWLEHNMPYGRLTQLAVLTGKKKTWRILGKRNVPLEKNQVIFMRKDPPFSIDYVMATSILSLVNSEKTFIINNPSALRNFNEKLGILQFPEMIPETIVTKKYSDIITFLKKHKKIVLKPLEGYAGREIFVLNLYDKNRNALLEVVTHHEQRYIMVQKYLSAAKYGDKRILLLNGEILGQENRIAAPDDYRNNISAGGVSHKTKLTRREQDLCERVGKKLASQGIYFAGLDMIGGYITEINVTSPTGLVDINGHEGLKLERKVVDFLDKEPLKNYA